MSMSAATEQIMFDEMMRVRRRGKYLPHESNYTRLFGTPERAARTLIVVREECEDIGTCYPNCPFDDAPACPSSIEPRDYDALLEWLMGGAEHAEGGTVSKNYIDDGESGSTCPIPRANVIFEGQKLTFDDEDSVKFAELVKGHFRKLVGLRGDA